MATYTNLAGAGVRALTTGTLSLFVTITAFGPGFSTGRGAPTNFFHLGLIRPQWHGASYPVVPLDAAQQIISLPRLCDGFGWSLTPGTAITVTEDFT